MIVTTSITMDLKKKDPQETVAVEAVQGEAYSRALEVALYAGGAAWTIPDGISALVRYRKSDGTGGSYDRLPDGATAWQAEGNTITVRLAPQMFTAPGYVFMQVELALGTSRIATFTIRLHVEEDPSAEVEDSMDYVNARDWLVRELDRTLQSVITDGVLMPKLTMGAVTTLSPGSGATASFSGTGAAPVLNLGLPAGRTPVKGLDYWTPAERLAMELAVEEALRPELIGQLQQYPAFAESVDKCTDPTQLYVLPDGFLYASIPVQGNEFSGTNQVTTSQALDSTAVYNGVGYKAGVYLSSSGSEGAKAGHIVTGYIPWSATGGITPPTLYVMGGALDRIGAYGPDKGFKITYNADGMPTVFTMEKLGTDYYKLTPIMDGTHAKMYTAQGAIGYLRFDFVCDSGADLIVTINEEIKVTTVSSYRWTNTGHAFVPADYEGRIIGLEDRLKVLEKGEGSVLAFANSVEECTDARQLYVLPDGFLYASIPVLESGYFGTNLVTASQALDSTAVYNGVGYKAGAYLSSSGGDGSKAGHIVTGCIPWSATGGVTPPTVYVMGGTLDRIGAYGPDKGFKITYNADGMPTVFTMEKLGTDYYKLTPIMDGTHAKMYTAQGAIGYLRFDFVCDSGADLIVTLNQEIKVTTVSSYRWLNTGYTYQAADYEGRIAELEKRADRMDEALSVGTGGVPDYVLAEAQRVAHLVQGSRTGRSLVFAALSDIHYPYDDGADNATTQQALLHAGMGVARLRRHLPLDFLSLMGDHVKGAGTSTVAESKGALKFIHEAMYDAGLGVQQIWLQGNHDRNPYDTDDGDLTDDELYSYIFAHNTGAVVDGDDPQRGYGYKDFEAQKIRVIFFNTSDISQAAKVSDHMFSRAQLEWMVNRAFDLSGKEDPAQWGILTLSHAPFNWGGDMDCARDLIDGYISGTRGTVTTQEGHTVSFDFTSARRGEFIASINGHTHNFRCSRIGANGFWQIAVPQVCAGRYNEYGTSWPEVGGELDGNGKPVYYYKTADTARDTSFCVFVVDRKGRKIHAIHYGAGIDRELEY